MPVNALLIAYQYDSGMNRTCTFPRRSASPRGRSENWFDHLLSDLTTLTRAHAWGVVAVVLALTSLVDMITGPDAWFGPVYLLVICLSTWTLGWRAGVSTGFACVALGILVNGLNIYPVGPVAFTWNLVMRVLAVAMIVVLIGSVRRSYDRERLRARTDGLTGALNKAGFFERLARERREAEWTLLCYIDLDGLKRINDEHGHAAGDDMLRAFTSGVNDSIRSTDVFARIGGDEFLICQTARTKEEAYHLARQLHSRLNAVQNSPGHLIRSSMGAVVIEPESASLSNADIDLADLLMYEAKRTGAGLSISGRQASTLKKTHSTVGEPPTSTHANQQRRLVAGQSAA